MLRPLLLVAVVAVVAGCRSPRGEGAHTTDSEPGSDSGDSGLPEVPAVAETLPATPLGLDALSVNGRVDVEGRPGVYWFELGETTAYGESTAPAPLPARPSAHYLESFTGGANGWQGGLSGTLLEHVESGGADGGGYVRYEVPGELDVNHADGIGANALAAYMYPGVFEGAPAIAALGGGDPDLRGARIAMSVRGEDFVQSTAELVLWAQSTPNLAEGLDPEKGRWSNWAYTGAPYTDGLFSGDWEPVGITLLADTTRWTYAGHYVVSERETYIYRPIDEVLSHLNGDIFNMLVLFEYGNPPGGALAFDEYQIDYANESVLHPDNGGALLTAPAGTDSTALTDGWRHGEGHTWQSDEGPLGPLQIVYELGGKLALRTVQVHQDPEYPSRALSVQVSEDGENWTDFAEGELPESAVAGPNYAYFLSHREEPVSAKYVMVRVESGWQDTRWGLGEVEAFADDAELATEDDWVFVTADFAGLTAGTTYHYRVVVEDAVGQAAGEDRIFTVPATAAPWVQTGLVTRIAGGTATAWGRIDPLGVSTNYQFEYGLDTEYGALTQLRYAGVELTPRTVSDQLLGLVSGETYHVRLRAESEAGVRYGEDVSFVAD